MFSFCGGYCICFFSFVRMFDVFVGLFFIVVSNKDFCVILFGLFVLRVFVVLLIES